MDSIDFEIMRAENSGTGFAPTPTVNLRKDSDDQIIAQADVDFSRWVHETWARNRPRVELNALIGPLRDAHPAPLFRYVPWG